MTRNAIAQFLGISEEEIIFVEPGEVMTNMLDVLKPEVWKVGLQTSSNVQFWRIRGHYYLDDPLFSDGLIDFQDLDYDQTIGLHIRNGKGPLTPQKLPDPRSEQEQPANKFTVVAQGDITDMFFAMNYYISTGDHIGEGPAIDHGETMMFVVAHKIRELEDRDNWDRLNARLGQMCIEDAIPIAMSHLGQHKGMIAIGVHFAKTDIQKAVKRLKAKPGPMGWGSMRSFLIAVGLIKNTGE